MTRKGHRPLTIILALVVIDGAGVIALAQTQPTTPTAQRSGAAAAPRQQRPRPAGEARVAQAPQRNDGPAPSAPGQSPNRTAPEGARLALAPPPPVILTQEEARRLDDVLAKWEAKSDAIRTFKCQFTQLEYDPTFGNPKNNHLRAQGVGIIRYKAPDCGVYRVDSMQEWVPSSAAGGGEVKDSTRPLEHWVCDGKSIFQKDFVNKQVVEHPLPPEMRGKAISDGPLPFVFGAKAAQLKSRYWLKDITPDDVADTQVWLIAFPRFQHDAANFRRARIILNRADLLPFALEMTMPDGKASTVYRFDKPVVNDKLEWLKSDFAPPTTPFNWKKVVQPPPAGPDESPKPASSSSQANRATNTPPRK